jgi:hypothetical protein
MARIGTLLLLFTVAAAPVLGKEDDGRKKLFEEIGKLIETGDAAALGKLLAKDRKIDLRLHGVKEGKYRRKQAKSLLAAFFKAIEPKKVKLDEGKGTTGRYKVKYAVKATGKSVESMLHVFLVEEEESWRIGGILES